MIELGDPFSWRVSHLWNHECTGKVFNNVFASENFPLTGRYSPSEKLPLILEGQHYF